MKKYLFRMLVPCQRSHLPLLFSQAPGSFTLSMQLKAVRELPYEEKLLKSLHSPVKVEISEGVG